jgi:hypothetical protein
VARKALGLQHTFLPFFVDLDTPPTLTVGEAIWLPANLRNYAA